MTEIKAFATIKDWLIVKLGGVTQETFIAGMQKANESGYKRGAGAEDITPSVPKLKRFE